MHLLVRTAVLGACLSLAASAAAQTEGDDERARNHFRAGASYYEAGDYEDALREFERSQVLSGKAELFYNISLCHQQLHHYDEAAQHLRRYLEQVEQIENRANLERRLENLRERAAQQPDPPDGEGDGTSEQEPREEGTNVGAIAGFAIGGAGLLTAVVAGSMALGERSSLEDRGCGETVTCDAGKLRTRALVADIGVGLAVAGAALGVVMLLVGGGSDDEDDQARARVVPMLARDGGGAMIAGSF